MLVLVPLPDVAADGQARAGAVPRRPPGGAIAAGVVSLWRTSMESASTAAGGADAAVVASTLNCNMSLERVTQWAPELCQKP